MKFGLYLAAMALSLWIQPSFAGNEKPGTHNVTVERSSSSEERFFRRIIPQGSMVFQDMAGADANTFVGRNGYAYGAVTDIGTSDIVAETGALYREMGAAGRPVGSPTLTARYISVPIAAKWYMTGQENTSPYVKLGAMGSTLLSQDATSSPAYVGSPYTLNARTWELSALGALGGKIYLSQASDLVLEVSYIRGIDTVTTAADLYTSSLNVTTGLAINL